MVKNLRLVVAVVLSAVLAVACFAQRGEQNITPSRFLGKSFAECEKTLGKPKFSQNPSESHATFTRYYASPNKNVVRVVLSSPKTESADFVTYHFVKNKYSGTSACQAIGVKASVSSYGELQVAGQPFMAEWNIGTPQNSHPKEDWLTFFTKKPKTSASAPPQATSKQTTEEPVEPQPTVSTADALPTAEEIRQSIAPPWSSVPPAPAPYLTETAWAQRTDAYLEKVGRAGQARSNNGPVATWRMLILFYPNTDTDYKTPSGGTAHFTGSLSFQQIHRVQEALTKLSDVVGWHSGGYCDLQVTSKTIERPLTTFSGGDVKYQYPTHEKDCKQEVTYYNGSSPYDSIIIFYNSGPILQTANGLGKARGLGGGGVRGTAARINYGSDAAWDVTKPSAEILGAFVHEWTHGLDNFFTANGYETEKLHHLYNCRYRETKGGRFWHSLVLQGNLIHDADRRYGHSRAVWMSGSPRHPADLFPCQLTAPLPGAVFPANVPITLHWAKTKAPSGYRVRLYAADDRARPLMSQDTPTNAFTLPLDALKPGNYLWTVQARDRGKLSLVGESFELFIKPLAQVPPLQITGPHLPVRINGDGAEFRVDAGVSSSCGLLRVEAELFWPDGRTQSAWLHRRSPNEGETMWTGSFKALPNTGANERRCTVHITATDQAGRTNVSEKVGLLVGSFVQSPIAKRKAASESAASIKLFSLVIPTQSDVPLLIQAEVTGMPINSLAGNVWAEVTRPDGEIDHVALVGRGWDEGWTGFTAPRQGTYYFPPNETSKDLAWKITYFFSDPLGKVTRSDTQTLWQYRPYSKMDLFARSFGNLLDGAKWENAFLDGTAGTFTPPTDAEGDDGSANYVLTTTKAGRFEYNIQFSPILPSLENGKKYTVFFEAKADRAGEMFVTAEMFYAPYLQTGLNLQTIKLTPQWKRWEFTFTALNGDKGPIKIPNFRRGLETGTVWVRGVTLKRVLPTQ